MDRSKVTEGVLHKPFESSTPMNHQATFETWQQSGAITIGDVFVFLRPPLAGRGTAWLNGPARTISRLDNTVLVPNASVPPVHPLSLELAILRSDRKLYAPDDSVNILAYDPLQPQRQSKVALYQDGMPLSELTLETDRLGLATARLEGLACGHYQLYWDNANTDFRVAVANLAPMLAWVEEQRREEPVLHLEVGVSSYGSPFAGALSVTLTEEGRALEMAEGVAAQGRLSVILPLYGTGPLSLDLASVADPSLTATLPLPGTSSRDRQPILLSGLGRPLTASLLPGPASQEVLGLHLEEGELHGGPLVLDRIGPRRVRLTANRTVQALAVVVVDASCCFPPVTHPVSPKETLARLLLEEGLREEVADLLEPPQTAGEYFLHGCLTGNLESLRQAYRQGYLPTPADLALEPPLQRQREQFWDELPAGGSIELELPGPLAVVHIGSFVDGLPREDKVVLPVATLDFTLDAPEKQAPGEIEIRLSGNAEAAYVVVKDARLLNSDTAASALASRLKAYAEGRPAGPARRPSPPISPPAPEPSRVTNHAPHTLADQLEAQGLVSRANLERVRQLTQRTGVPFGEALLELSLLAENELGRVWAQALEIAFVELDGQAVSRQMALLLPEALCWRYRVIPLMIDESENLLTLAMVNPTDTLALDDVGLITGFTIEPVLVTYTQLDACLHASYEVVELAEVEETVKDISCQDFGAMEYEQIDPGAGSYEMEMAAVDTVPDSERAARTLFAGLVLLQDGVARLPIEAERGEWLVEALAMGKACWSYASARVRVAKSPELSLQTPTFVWPEDAVTGSVTVVAGEGRLMVERDDEVVLDVTAGKGQRFTFPARPGRFQARLLEESGASDTVASEVTAPGRFRTVAKAVLPLTAGQSLPSEGVLEVRLLPGIGHQLSRLIEATADFEHCCCEQTAAKLLALAAGYALAQGDAAQRHRCQLGIAAGLQRMRAMFHPGRGFSLYPGDPIDDFWGPKAATYLWDFTLLDPARLEPGLGDDVQEALKMAADATEAYRMKWPPVAARDAQQVFAMARFSPGRAGQALSWARTAAAALRVGDDRVRFRADAAFLASTLLLLGDVVDRKTAMALANQCLRDLEGSGRLYSTADSAAALALLQTIAKLPLQGRLRVGDRVIDAADLQLAEPLTGPLEVLEGEALFEVLRERQTDWLQGEADLLYAGLEATDVRAGQRIRLWWRLTSPYQPGDLLWVCLPQALSRLEGGGQLKFFSIDLQGRDRGELELVATGATPEGPQHFMLCLRNMFREERIGPSPLLSVQVASAQAASTVGPAPPSPANLIGGGWRACWTDPSCQVIAERRLADLQAGWLEVGGERFEEEASLSTSATEERMSREACGRLTVGLLQLARLAPSASGFPQVGSISYDGRDFGLLAAITDAGDWRVRVVTR